MVGPITVSRVAGFNADPTCPQERTPVSETSPARAIEEMRLGVRRCRHEIATLLIAPP